MPLRDLAIVIPTLNAARNLPGTLAALQEMPVVVADGGSTDGTPELARRLGAIVIAAPRGRGPQLAAGAAVADASWLLFLHADTRLGEGWREAVAGFVATPGAAHRAAHFRFALDEPSAAARRLTRAVAWRCRVLGLPYGDQGLLIHRDLYAALGGFPPLPLFEDVALVRALGRRRLVALPAEAVTSAARWRRDGWLFRSARNLLCLTLYFAGLPPRLIARLYA
ncbi:TIGR04283 family arsenosugar biosynthesis glycosyltransferase [Teichococcus coralli]|uniref:TIGR04283 family arsenosugar biosynthesis glycosyltransferase n=1 Tax=Teichococcus coralli TaxID=2545983 RepID=UPI0034625694